ncbi:uncharacterized protein B0H18DRAFT_1115460 [Fomitopsis serialis]|uniref:uncharacterized protein n=1 Tax=Fomitopsis serialis TaxID=139415 RepID=UPI00200739DE|nr:uncharacterized protein B0H18DRAFT_1115460 [Neoantrodia serialis]KAH9933466.1 hypothetical protein B0H18DRAFT_1115460 [Neoantrodia serialis]
MQPYVQEKRQHSPSIFVRTASGEGWQRMPSPSPESPSSPLQSPSSSRPGSRDRPSSPSDVHTAVSKLIALVKQLQDVLHSWGLRHAREEQVSDAFVLVGQQFNTTVNVLWRHKVDMSDMIHIIVDLREVLENCLGEEPSPHALDRYMPQVRRVVYELLVGLRSKQGPYWNSVYAGGQRRQTPGLERQSV